MLYARKISETPWFIRPLLDADEKVVITKYTFIIRRKVVGNMMRQNFKDWADREFGYPIPQEYLSFLEKGEPEPAGRKYYVTNEGNALEISEWFTPDNIPVIYKNCREEK